MASRTRKRRAPKKHAVQTPKQHARAPGGQQPWFVWAAVALVAVGGIVAAVVVKSGSNKNETAAPARGLPNTPDYHSLSVDPTNANRILLGTHYGLYRSSDGGKTWAFEALSGRDAMNLARPGGQTLWTAGHYVLAKSTDGGRTWVDVRPSGLPTLDVHGFAVDPRRPSTLYAAVAGRGLYRSTDNGVSFTPVSSQVGGAVMALVEACPCRGPGDSAVDRRRAEVASVAEDRPVRRSGRLVAQQSEGRLRGRLRSNPVPQQ